MALPFVFIWLFRQRIEYRRKPFPHRIELCASDELKKLFLIRSSIHKETVPVFALPEVSRATPNPRTQFGGRISSRTF
jgi:hypothetical protein